MDNEDSHYLLNCYLCKNQSAPAKWFEWDENTGKEKEVATPTVSESLQNQIDNVSKFIRSTDFWTKNSFAGIIKIICNMDDHSILLSQARIDFLAFNPKFDRKHLQWFFFHPNDYEPHFYAGVKVGEECEVKCVDLKKYKEIQSFVQAFEKSAFKTDVNRIVFGMFNNKLLNIELE